MNVESKFVTKDVEDLVLPRKVGNDCMNFKLDDVVNISKLEHFNFSCDVFISGLGGSCGADIKLMLLALSS